MELVKVLLALRSSDKLTQRWDVIAHELGHAWLAFEDLYLFKGVLHWGNGTLCLRRIRSSVGGADFLRAGLNPTGFVVQTHAHRPVIISQH